MSQQQIKTEDLRVFFKSAFEKAGYERNRTEKFCKAAERLHDYMVAHKEKLYTPDIGMRFISMEQDSGETGFWTLKNDRRAIEVINMILAGEPITINRKPVPKSYPGEIGNAAMVFLKHLETDVRSAQSSLARYACVLSPFSHYCQMNGITLNNINYSCIVGYMSSRQNTDIKTTSVLRIFFKYLYDSDILETDHSLEIRDTKPRHREKIPSFYSKSEILRIEGSIERTSPMGKRDYAIVKLASRLGLRASDIAALEFSNIDWEKNVISLRQVKTGKCVSPHRPMTGGAISAVVSKTISDAGIDINGRRHGAHSLRHSLAYNMLDSGSTLGMISNALGHSSEESTMTYLGVDIRKLMECSLTVLPVDSAFYNQGGGLLYD